MQSTIGCRKFAGIGQIILLKLICLRFNTISDHPSRPEIIERKVSGCNLTLKWTTPQWNECPILFYTIRHRQKEATHGAKNWAVVNITDPTANQRELRLNCSTTYEFQVKAWNELGGGAFSTVQSATTESATTQDDTEGLSASGTQDPGIS